MQIDNTNDILLGMTILMLWDFFSFYCEHGGYKSFIPSAFGSLWHELHNSKYLIDEITLLTVISCIVLVSTMRSSGKLIISTLQTEDKH